MTILRRAALFFLCMGAIVGLTSLASAWQVLDPVLVFNNGVPTRGMLMWSPAGVAPQGCNPSTCYTGGGGVGTQLALPKLAVLASAKVGHIRYGIDPSPILADPANTAAYVASAFAGVDTLLNTGFKVVINNAPSTSWAGWTADDIADGGPTSAKFMAYVSYLQTMAEHVAANPTLYPPTTVAFSVFNETPIAANVTGGISAQYLELITMFQAVRAILPRHTIILCLTADCSAFNLVGFSGWSASSFDANTMIDVHAYMPLAGAFACQPGTEWRDLCGALSYPPTASPSAYSAAVAIYESNLAADNTWAVDCPSGPNCTAARAANKATIEGNYTYDGIRCSYGQSPGGFPCPSGEAEGSAWLTAFYAQITSWLPAGVTAKQIYIGEFGVNGTTADGAGVGAAGQASMLGDVAAAIDAAGFSRAVLETNYSSAFSIGSGFGMFNQSSPYAPVNPAAMAALNFDGN